MSDLEIEFGKMEVAEINNLFLEEFAEALRNFFGFEN
jgi:hypothetical protein